MPLKRYGIYLAYTPATDLRSQGLGRHLAAFLKSAREREDVRFVVACPSWMRQNLNDLCEEEGVDVTCFDIIAPARRPLVLEIREWYQTRKQRPKRVGRLGKLFRRLRAGSIRVKSVLEQWLVSNRSIGLLVLFVLLMFPVAVLGVLAHVLIRAALAFRRALAGISRFLAKQSRLQFLFDRLGILVSRPSGDPAGKRLFSLMEEAEIRLMHKMIRDEKDILAWYCPTPFWPNFNQISAPRLLCVPDVVPTDSPGGFALANGQAGLDIFCQIEAAIREGDHFVTYSRQVKWHTLVDRFEVAPESVDVVPHGASRLDEFINVSGWGDNIVATEVLCRNLFRMALLKSLGNRFASYFSEGIQFLFYSSQFRPNKNIFTLLRAFEYLLRQRYRGHKLVLTGDPIFSLEVASFIQEHNLENDVLCLHGLSVQELGACYHLAELAINPSLSEGGFPFTFTEAISVGTPVVMARIPVTEEVLGEQEFYPEMSFDPYDWRDMADRIEWALDHSAALYARQRAFYDAVLVKRSWRTMVDEYIAILERISMEPRQPDDAVSQPRLRMTASV